jgi:hypothetical protein
MVYKVKRFDANKNISEIYVFIGYNHEFSNTSTVEDFDSSVLDENTDFLENGALIFSKEEIKSIKRNSSKIVFVNDEIYLDDDITTIKLKILHYVSNHAYSLEEMYLFCSVEKTLDANVIYESLIPLTKQKLTAFLSNISGMENKIEELEDKPEYNYDDLMTLLINIPVIMNIPVGQKMFIGSDEYPFTVNPNYVTKEDTFLQKPVNTVTLVNRHLLLNVASKIHEDSVYLCLAEDVIQKESDYIIKIYFPLLYDKRIITLDILNEKKMELLTNTEDKILTDVVTNNFKNVNLFNNIYHERTEDLSYKQSGIQKIRVTLRPEYTVKIPLDIIFKIIHATEENPLIKYNFSSRQDNIYRLYTDNISETGVKIPFLSKIQIFKLMKTIGTTKSVAVYIIEPDFTVVCEFEENGNIIITADFNENITKVDSGFDEINRRLIQSANPVIETVQVYFQQNGYKINDFKSILESNVDVDEIVYKSVISFGPGNFSVQNFIRCLNSVFIVNKETRQEINLTFIRVKNFNMLISQETYISEQQKSGLSDDDIIEGLIETFNLDRATAREIYLRIIQEKQMRKSLNRRDIEIKDKSGFKINILIDRIKHDITFMVFGIDNIQYLNIIPIYIDTLVRLNTDNPKTKHPENIQLLCSQKGQEGVFETKEGVLETKEDVSPPAVAAPLALAPAVVPALAPEVSSPSSDATKTEAEDALMALMFSDSDSNSNSNSSNNSNNSNGGANIIGMGPKKKIEKQRDEKDVLDDKNNVEDADPVIISDIDPKLKDIAQDWDNKQLHNPNYFQKRIEDRAKSLFVHDKDKNFKGYSRMCPSNVRRQPVSLTQSELDHIKETSPNYLNEAQGDILPYTSNNDDSNDKEKNYYICPRYWCLLTNSPISSEDVKSGKCGQIITNDVVKPGHYIYKFASDKNYPGFLANKTIDNKCLPCCFKSKNHNEKCNTVKEDVQKKKKSQVVADDAIVEKLPVTEDVKEVEKEVKQATTEAVLETEAVVETEAVKEEVPEDTDKYYIINAEKLQIDANRWGYLPVSIQKFFKEISCKIHKTKKSDCLLRHGIQNIKNRSFLACITDAIFFAEHDEANNLIPVPEVMINDKNPAADTETVTVSVTKRIIDIVQQNLDLFITYQNGTLIDTFASNKTYENDLEINSEFNKVSDMYKNSKIYKKSVQNPKQKQFFLKVINALENFVLFLKDESVVVDYTYLWDIISDKHDTLFKKGVNLVILNIPDNDSTNNIEFICPSNHYSKHIFNPNHRTLFIIKRDDFYEPIYLYKDNGKGKIEIRKTFSDNDPHKSDNIKSLFTNIIKPIIKQNCSPKPSNSLYKFKRPVQLEELIKKILSKKYTINNLVLNLRGKIIGVVATTNKSAIRGFLPCEPTVQYDQVSSKYDYIYITDEPQIWNTYENTLAFLRNWYREIQPAENLEQCSTFCKVIEDEHIVGFLTNTNQFIQLSEPKPNTEDNVHSVNNNNYLIAENEIITTNKVDRDRVGYINKIKYEYNFYNAFRKTMRILLNDSSQLSVKSEIRTAIENNTIPYPTKLELVKQKIMILAENKIEFTDEVDYESFREISACITYQQDKCNTKNPMCLYTGDKCVLIIPKNNLITPAVDNSDMYYTKMADELIRFNNIKNFMFQTKNYLSFDKIGYNLNDDEIILLESLLTAEYFDKLVRSPSINKYVINNTRDNTNPINTGDSNPNQMIALKLNEIVQYEEEEKEVVKTQISSVKIRECFPANCTELEYSATCQGTFQFIIDILQKTNGIQITEQNLREILVRLYEEYSQIYKSSLINIWSEQGKRGFANKIKKGLNFKDIIEHQTYYLTNLDLWLLLVNFRIPSIFISPKPLLDKNEAFVAFKNPDEGSNMYVFIVIPTIKEEPRSYKVIEYENRIYIDFVSSEKCSLTKSIQYAMSNTITIEQQLSKRPDVVGGYTRKRSRKSFRKTKSRKHVRK